ncbi:MAG: peptidoglycan editing factor PgeF [Phycisphaerales bacterium]
MLVATTHAAGPTTLTSPLLTRAGFAHAFSTRLGGVSPAPFDSLNLQSTQANARIAATDPRDTESNILENHARFATAAGLAAGTRLVDICQVHSATVVTAADAALHRTAADALTSPRGGHAILIRIADCVPILLACPRTGAVAAVHAGWRGVVAGIAPATVAALRTLGVDPRDCLAAVGPCISAPHFEIGPEVADALVAADLAECVAAPGRHGPKHHADLVLAVRLQLERAGLATSNIDAEPPCTYAHPARFHSYRRDGADSGRLAAIIAPRSA